MEIEHIDDSVIDRIWRREEVTDNELWDKFWSLTEPEARAYAQDRWFRGRTVNQNHITRKVKRFWPVIDGAVTRVRNSLQLDPTFPKVWRAYNYDYEVGGSLGFLMAGTRDEATRLFQLFLPTSEAEAGHSRFVDLAFVAPVEDARAHCAMHNAVIAGNMTERIREQRETKAQVIAKHDAKIAKIEARQDAFMILMASVGGGIAEEQTPVVDSNDSSSSDAVAEEVDF